MKKIVKVMFLISSIILSGFLLAACSGKINSNKASQCNQGLNAAYQELNFAKAQGFGGTVDWAKAHSLLAAAATQQQFEKYPNCIEKVNRARFYIKQSQKVR